MTLDLYRFDVLKWEKRFCTLPRFSWEKREPMPSCGVGLKQFGSLEWPSLYSRCQILTLLCKQVIYNCQLNFIKGQLLRQMVLVHSACLLVLNYLCESRRLRQANTKCTMSSSSLTAKIPDIRLCSFLIVQLLFTQMKLNTR